MHANNGPRQSRTMYILSAALVLALLATILGCGTKPQNADTSEDPAPGGEQTHVFADDSIFALGDRATAEKLFADMDAGRIPASCNVLYDSMGMRPAVEVTDPDTIVQIFELASDIRVVGKSNMSVTDMYHHFYFTLQDGSTIGFNFEGAGIVSIGRDNYEVKGAGPLWEYVRELQNVD